MGPAVEAAAHHHTWIGRGEVLVGSAAMNSDFASRPPSPPAKSITNRRRADLRAPSLRTLGGGGALLDPLLDSAGSSAASPSSTPRIRATSVAFSRPPVSSPRASQAAWSSSLFSTSRTCRKSSDRLRTNASICASVDRREYPDRRTDNNRVFQRTALLRARLRAAHRHSHSGGSGVRRTRKA